MGEARIRRLFFFKFGRIFLSVHYSRHLIFIWPFVAHKLCFFVEFNTLFHMLIINLKLLEFNLHHLCTLEIIKSIGGTNAFYVKTYTFHHLYNDLKCIYNYTCLLFNEFYSNFFLLLFMCIQKFSFVSYFKGFLHIELNCLNIF